MSRKKKSSTSAPPPRVPTLSEQSRTALRPLAFAAGGCAFMHRTVAEMHLSNLHKTLGRIGAVTMFIQDAARHVVAELIHEGDGAAAEHLVTELGKIALPDGTLLSVDPVAGPLLDDVRASIPSADAQLSASAA